MWNNVEAETTFTVISRERYIICLLRVLQRICQQGITGQRNDTIVDSLETAQKSLNYRQPNNKSAAVFVKDMKKSYNTVIEVCGHGAFGVAAFCEAINEGVGN